LNLEVILALSLLTLPTAFAAKAPVTTFLCANESGMGQPPKLTVTAGSSHRLFLCATHAKKRKGGVELQGGFRVFALGKKGKKRVVYTSESSVSIHRAEKKGSELLLDELLWDGKQNVPAFETAIACDAKGCRASSPAACVFEKPKPGSRRALEQIADYQKGKKQGKVPEKNLIDSLAALAYSGDEDAQALFRDRGALSLDGASSDAYFEHQGSIERLKKAGCL
jgi:hypothetical protein